MAWRNRPGFDPARIDPKDESTWAIRDSDTCDASDIMLSEEACARIAAIWDRARAQRARATLRTEAAKTLPGKGKRQSSSASSSAGRADVSA